MEGRDVRCDLFHGDEISIRAVEFAVDAVSEDGHNETVGFRVIQICQFLFTSRRCNDIQEKGFLSLSLIIGYLRYSPKSV